MPGRGLLNPLTLAIDRLGARNRKLNAPIVGEEAAKYAARWVIYGTFVALAAFVWIAVFVFALGTNATLNRPGFPGDSGSRHRRFLPQATQDRERPSRRDRILRTATLFRRRIVSGMDSQQLWA